MVSQEQFRPTQQETPEYAFDVSSLAKLRHTAQSCKEELYLRLRSGVLHLFRGGSCLSSSKEISKIHCFLERCACRLISTEWLGFYTVSDWLFLEETSQIQTAYHLPLVSLGIYGKHLQLYQVAQVPIQPDLECFQGWGIYCLSGKHVPVSPPSP